MKVVTGEQMRAIDKTAIEERGIPGLKLMENAGRATTDEILRLLEPQRVAIVTGKGNNAGDGFVIARLLAEDGIETMVCLLAPGSELEGDALENFKRMPRAVEKIDIGSAEELETHLEKEWDCVVDAVLGTGIKGAARGLFGEAIEVINRAPAPVVAVDIPSGLPSDDSPIEGPVVRAALTVTMGLPKLGMVLGPASDYIEHLVVADIGFPEDLVTDEKYKINLTTREDVADLLPERRADSHKGTYGSCLVVAGSRGMSGAAILTAEGVQRSGTGLVFVATPENMETALAQRLVEPLQLSIPTTDGWRFDLISFDDILEAAEERTAIALGPGLGTHETTRALVAGLCRDLDKPMVLDADGLNCLVGQCEEICERKAALVITPHPGELARLLDVSVKDIQADRLKHARQAAERFQCVVVLKGAATVVCEPGGEVHINSTGNHGMAKGGMGDVLTGLIGGLLAQGMTPLDAARAGVFLHGLAGDVASEASHPRAITAMDLVESLGEAFGLVE